MIDINITMKDYIRMLMEKNEDLFNKNKELKEENVKIMINISDISFKLREEQLKNKKLEDENDNLKEKIRGLMKELADTTLMLEDEKVGKVSTVAEDELVRKALEYKNKQLEKKLEELVLENAYLRKRDFSRIEKIVERRVNESVNGVTVVIV